MTGLDKDIVSTQPDSGEIGITEKFALLNRLVFRDLNRTHVSQIDAPLYHLYTKRRLDRFLKDPVRHARELRRAVLHIWAVSPHFRRIIEYFVGLNDQAYVVSPFRIDPAKVNRNSMTRNYRRVLNTLAVMNLRTWIPKATTVCFREDVGYWTIWETSDNITFQQLPFDRCQISTMEGNVFNVSFDFSYFDNRESYLAFYPAEFTEKFRRYQASRFDLRWQELDSPTSFAIKYNTDRPDVIIPPFAGLLRDIHDIDNFKNLKLNKAAIENYAMIAMKIPLNDDGEYGLDYDKAKTFWRNLDGVLPEEVGSVLTPMELEKVSFERTNVSDKDTVAEAERDLFTAAGVSSLLFNNEKAAASALLLSIKADQNVTFGVIKSIEDALNRFLQAKNYGKNFKVTFLNTSCYNSKDAGDAYLKACTYGLPFVSYYAASQGMPQGDIEAMHFLERELLNIPERFVPLQNSNTMSAQTQKESKGATDEGGRPEKAMDELTEKTEINEEYE